MKERPLIMYPHEVRAVRDGRQTQFRRVCRDQTAIKYEYADGIKFLLDNKKTYTGWVKIIDELPVYLPIKCPYGVPVDRLWVRETWAMASFDDHLPVRIAGESEAVWYKDGTHKSDYCDVFIRGRWRSPIHMPRWACRLLLEVVSVRVERLQEITKWDAIAEGMVIKPLTHVEPRFQFERLWNSINGKAHPWDSNPWVWVVEFKLIENRG